MSTPPFGFLTHVPLTSVVLSSLIISTAVADPTCNTTVPPLGIDCPTTTGVSFTYADPDHCSMYWECFNHCSNHLKCSDGMLYDSTHKWCNTASDVYCGDRDCDGLPCKEPPTTNHPWAFICPEDGYFADPLNCIKYYVCSGGIAEPVTCPKASNGEQEFYNAEEVYCDYQDRVDCGDRPVCDENDEGCHEVTTPPPGPCDSITCGPDGWIPEGDCAKCTCECVSGNPYEICCGNGLFWNPSLNVCDYPGNIAACP